MMVSLSRIARMAAPLTAISLVVFACNSRKEKGGVQDTTPIFSAAEISYPLVNQYVFSKSCYGCHGNGQAQGNVSLESYEGAAKWVDQIKADVDSGRMPKSPTPPLSVNQKAMIDVWVAQHGPNAAGGPGVAPKPPLTATFVSIKESVFGPKCATCHNPTGKAKNVKLDQPKDLLVGQNILVVAGKPEASKLVRVVSPGARRPMPPVGKGEALTEAEVAQITDWIASGAADDEKLKSIEDNIIQGEKHNCTNCHTAEGSAERVSLDSWKDLTGGGEPLVFPKLPDMSYLLNITAPGNPKMPPATSGIAPLTQEEWNVIREWISNGANQ